VIALRGVGLDPGIAIFHLDRDRRPSLTLDAIDAVRRLRRLLVRRMACRLPLCKARLRRVAGLGDPHHAPADEPPRDERSDLGQAAAAVSGWRVQKFGRSCRRRRSAHRWDYSVSTGPARGSYAEAGFCHYCRRRCQPSSRPAARIGRPPSRMTRSPELATNAVRRFQFVPANSALRDAPLRITAIPNFERSSPPSPPAAPIPNDHEHQISPSASRQAAARHGRDRRCSGARWLR